MSAPGPMSDADAAIEASIRMKLNMGEPLTWEERQFFARMPADDELYVRRRTSDSADSRLRPR